MILSSKQKLLLSGLTLLAILSAGLYLQSQVSYYKAKASDSATIIADMEKQYAESALKYQMKINQIEIDNIILVQTKTDELSSIRKQHEDTISALNSGHSDRMRNMQKRIQEYARIAEGSSVECRDLADHTTQLDRTLEEGRHLVGELRAGIELRDNQLKKVGELLLSERKLLTE